MEPKNSRREEVLERLEEAGGLRPGATPSVHRSTGIPAADIYGVATFYHLLAEPDIDVRVCQGLSCHLANCKSLLEDFQGMGLEAAYTSCVGRCDLAPAHWRKDGKLATPAPFLGSIGEERVFDLDGGDGERYEALAQALDWGPDRVCQELEASGLQGRGGAGFPAFIKWNAVRGQAETERYIVLNADEGEPGTFKDREVMLRRPHLVIEGLAIAALTLGAQDIYLYIRGEFEDCRQALAGAVATARRRGDLDDSVHWHFVDGHGAYICGEETALLEALEGKRGLPRLKPPFPVEKGFRQKPTLIQNVETIACVPAILRKGGAWFRALGTTEPGTKLYCLSGHVQQPGVYEAPLGTPLSALIAAAGGTVGTLKAFSPGGASSGFLPARQLDIAMDFGSLRDAGTMLGSAGAVLLNDTVDMVEAALVQAVFFEDESCGQCAPCRIGTRSLRRALESYLTQGRSSGALDHVREVAWGMGEASICGLGQTAALPMTSAMKYFPEEFGL